MAFTSPAVIEKAEVLTLTSKASYVWAGAVAHILSRRPSLDAEQIVGFLRTAFREHGRAYADRALNQPVGSNEYVAAGYGMVQAFLRAAGFDHEAFAEACGLTEDAIRSLEWLQIIEDPIRKKIAGILLSVYALAGPVNFSATGPKDFTYATMTWQASAQTDGKTDETRFTFNLKVDRIAKAIIDELIPGFEKVINEAAAAGDSASRDSSPSMSPEELQSRLKDLGYYDGAVDGKVGPRTYAALKRFQQDRNLKVTSYPDSATVGALRESRRW